MTSTSIFKWLPIVKNLNDVFSHVCGIILIPKELFSTEFTVKEIPSNVTEPLGAINFDNLGSTRNQSL